MKSAKIRTSFSADSHFRMKKFIACFRSSYMFRYGFMVKYLKNSNIFDEVKL
jgi:hypothetical protein